MNSYTLIIVSVFLLAADFAVQKLYQRHVGADLVSALIFNTLTGLLSAILFFAVNGFRVSVTPFSLLMGFCASLFCVSYSLISFRILEMGNMALYTLSLMAGGMMVPYVFGLLFLNEPPVLLRFIGLFIILFSVILSNFSLKNSRPLLIVLCLSVFFLNGFVSVSSKLQSSGLYPAVSSSDFIVISGFWAFLLSGAALIVFRKKADRKPSSPLNLTALGLIFLHIALSKVSYLFQLIGAETLPASVLYPFITGGSVVLSALFGILFFKERVSKKVVISTVLCLIGTLLFL